MIMKYDRMLEKVKSERKVGLLVGVPIILILLFGCMKMTKPFSGGGPLAILILLAILVAGALFISQYSNYDKKFARMRQAVGAGSNAELAQMIEHSESFEDYYFVTEQYFFNFFTFRAYPRSQIRSVRCTEDHDENGVILRYSLELTYGSGECDSAPCDSMKTREQLYELLRNQKPYQQQAQNDPFA